jgi:Holliday junction resolvase RusA-like endonuclease
MGFNWIRCLVTRKIVKQVKDAMKEAGFRRDDGRFASFFREI